LQTQLNALQTHPEEERLSDPALAALYTVVGSVRGLIDAMTSTQGIMKEINWAQLAATRF
jgi:hypothetical protein